MKQAHRHLCGCLKAFPARGPRWFPGPDRKQWILRLSVVVLGKGVDHIDTGYYRGDSKILLGRIKKRTC